MEYEEKIKEIMKTAMRFVGSNGLLTLDTGQSKKFAAKFRHSAGRSPGEDPELFGWFAEHVPTGLQGAGSHVSREEEAIFTAVSLYGCGPKHSSSAGSLGKSVRDAGIDRERLAMVETADDIEAMRQPLRALMQLLASKGGRINYAVLAADLYKWQQNKTKTSIRWERNYAQKEEK